MKKLSIVLPVKNEAESLDTLLPAISSRHGDAEVIVVNDGSSDNTADVARKHGARIVNHPYTKGNGAAIKTGARAATGDVNVFMDGDGQHSADDIARLIEKHKEGYDMVAGARSFRANASFIRFLANYFYNWLATAMTGFQILDLTSGFRLVDAKKFRKYLYLLPNGFSYPTTITMAFFRSGFSVGYVPISAQKRLGKSKIRLFRDGLRFVVIILKIGALFSPMRLFIPISFAAFLLGLGYYGYTYVFYHRLTNMSAVLFLSALLILLIGIVSEQVSSLHYRWHQEDDND